MAMIGVSGGSGVGVSEGVGDGVGEGRGVGVGPVGVGWMAVGNGEGVGVSEGAVIPQRLFSVHPPSPQSQYASSPVKMPLRAITMVPPWKSW